MNHFKKNKSIGGIFQTLRSINHDYAKLSIQELIHNVWISIRLNNLKAGHKTNGTKKLVESF